MIALFLYEISIAIFYLDGLSFHKLTITSLLWASLAIIIREYVIRYRTLKRLIPNWIFLAVNVLLLWNIICSIRSLFDEQSTVITVVGNIYTSIALLVPFVFILSLKKHHIPVLDGFLKSLLKAGVVSFVIFMAISIGNPSDVPLRILYILLMPVIFLIPQLLLQKNKDVLLIILCSGFMFYTAFKLSIRTMMIREILLFVCAIAISFYARFRFKSILIMAFLTLATPFVLVYQSTSEGTSPFYLFLSDLADTDLRTDTRTFLYTELYEDLVFENQLLTGKGSDGRYYSEYFSEVEGDASTRLNIEVGILGILLKGGLIAVFLNLLLLLSAIFYAFFRSRNIYVVSLGFILLIHTVLLFIENVVSYSTYNFVIWLFIAMCFATPVRMMTNAEIKYLLGNKMRKIL